jgi:hypothetical protein
MTGLHSSGKGSKFEATEYNNHFKTILLMIQSKMTSFNENQVGAFDYRIKAKQTWFKIKIHIIKGILVSGTNSNFGMLNSIKHTK